MMPAISAAGIPDIIGTAAANGRIVFDVAIHDTSIAAMASGGEVYRKMGERSEIFVAFKHSSNSTDSTENITILTEDRYAAGFLYRFSPRNSAKIGYISLRINGYNYSASGIELIHCFR